MKDISIYFRPSGVSCQDLEGTLGLKIKNHTEDNFPELGRGGVAIFSVPEYRNSEMTAKVNSDSFREQLYGLFVGDNWSNDIYDLGIIVPGESVDDTYFALSQTVSELIKKDIVPVIVGGSQDLTIACYKGYEALEQMINICSVDSRLDIGDPALAPSASGYVSHLLMQRPCYLFNYANIGMQRPLVEGKELDLFDKLYFDVCRLGEFNADFRRAEPYLRNSDLLTIDFKSIKSSETDAACYRSPNGLRAEQMCQVAKYAGLSDKLSSLAILDVDNGHNSTASGLLAEIIWYFLDGVSQRVGDFPIGTKKNYTKFHVHLDDFSDDLVFYKSDKSGRWWLEVKYHASDNRKYERHTLVPCNKEDYDRALENVIPNLWWKTLQKLA